MNRIFNIKAIDPVEREEEIEEVKRKALKDAGAYSEDAPVPDYSGFEVFLAATDYSDIVATRA